MWLPLLVLPLLAYNLVAFGLIGGDALAWGEPVFGVQMLSGTQWSASWGDALIVSALVLLLIEVLRAGRTGGRFVGPVASGVVFAAYLGEFLLVPAAATSLFFTCTAMSFIDLVVRLFASARGRERYDFDY